MKTLTSRLGVRLLLLAVLATASFVVSSEDGNACVRCVRLDPGSAIKYGCLSGTCWGDTSCTPHDYGCYLGGVWCTMGGNCYP
jgi:hypothetical protein